MFNEQKLNKYRDEGMMRDWFSDAVSSGLGSVGITKDIRDSVQPAIDAAKNLLPQGGAIPPIGSDIGSIPQATGYKYGSNVSPIILAGIAFLAAFFILRK